jgi:hypothetical protein
MASKDRQLALGSYLSHTFAPTRSPPHARPHTFAPTRSPPHVRPHTFANVHRTRRDSSHALAAEGAGSTRSFSAAFSVYAKVRVP